MGDKVKAMVDALKPGEVLMLENLRFHPEEEKNDPAFAKALAGWRRVHQRCLRHGPQGPCIDGRRMRLREGVRGGLPHGKGGEYITRVLTNPDRPFAAILGGAKVSDKLEIVENLLDRADKILIGAAWPSPS
jgi:3-phosphoglycerate kinase